MEPARQIGPRQPSSRLSARHQTFDAEMDERAELLREAGVRRDMMLAQLKADDEALKKYIAMI